MKHFQRTSTMNLLHHIPTNDPTPLPFERAFFDWIYLTLFESTPNSRAIWGGFLKDPIKREILDDFRQLSEKDLLIKYFRNGEEWLDIKQGLIHKMKKEIFNPMQSNRGKRSSMFLNYKQNNNITNWQLGQLFFIPFTKKITSKNI